jgi:tripartite-type tricarboxylate transporter receptor subunit TctC
LGKRRPERPVTRRITSSAMAIRMRRMRLALTLLLHVVAAGASAHAQSYPARPVTIVVPYAPGGGIDVIARMLAQRLTEKLGQPFLVENRLGAGGVIASTFVARAPADGHTLLLASDAQLAIQVPLRRNLPYNPVTDFAPIGIAGSTPFALLVNSSVPANSVSEFIALAKSRPGEMAYGSSGVGGTPHLVMEMFTSMSGTTLRHIPYKGTAQALNDLIGGTIPVMFSGLTGVPGLLSAGKVRALGISSRSRLKILPSIPTIAEAGLPEFEAMGFVILAAPAGTPSSIVDRLHAELNELNRSPDVQEKYESIGYVTDRSPPPAEVAQFIEKQIGLWTEVVARAGLTHSQ